MRLAAPGGMLALTTATQSAGGVGAVALYAAGVEVGVVEIPTDLRLECQAHPAQEELARKAPQAPQVKPLPAQQTSPRTQAGRCPS